jgi:hypothetical protein
MRQVIFPILAVFLVLTTSCSRHGNDFSPYSGTVSRNIDFIYTAIDTVFGRYVTADRGLVAYNAINADPLFQALVDSISRFDLGSLDSPGDSFAFMVNAYNVTVIYYLKKDFALQRQDSAGFQLFKRKYLIATDYITLDTLEKSTRYIKKFNDPRSHFVLVCGAMGCPPLLNRAYRGSEIYEQLDRQSFNFINNDSFNPILEGPKPKVSELFFWYGDDFNNVVRDSTGQIKIKDAASTDRIDFIASFLANQEKINRIRSMGIHTVTYSWEINSE